MSVHYTCVHLFLGPTLEARTKAESLFNRGKEEVKKRF